MYKWLFSNALFLVHFDLNATIPTPSTALSAPSFLLIFPWIFLLYNVDCHILYTCSAPHFLISVTNNFLKHQLIIWYMVLMLPTIAPWVTPDDMEPQRSGALDHGAKTWIFDGWDELEAFANFRGCDLGSQRRGSRILTQASAYEFTSLSIISTSKYSWSRYRVN